MISAHLLLILIANFLSHGKASEGSLRHAQETQLRYLILGETTVGPENAISYPTLLSPNVKNLSLRSLGPKVPSICTKSMIGNEIYDVIILEYHLSNVDGFDVLADRLRRRFPDALILFNILWTPSLIQGRDGNGKIVTFDEVWKKFNFKSPMTAEHITKLSSEMTSFELNPTFLQKRLPLLKQIKNNINGHLFGLDQIIQPQYWQNREWVLDRLSYFYDGTHYNQKGHEYVANGIKNIMEKLKPSVSTRVNAWGDEDVCHLWYGDGKVDISYSEGVQLNEFSEEKYALEVSSSSGAHFVINNPFPEPRPLLLSYMASSSHHDRYPKVEITLSKTFGKSFVLHPYKDQYDGFLHHGGVEDEYVMTTNLDYIPSGETQVFMKPLCDPCTLPFRLVGLSVAGRHVAPTFREETVVQDTTMAVVQPNLLWGKPESIIDIKDRKHEDDIRYASFGTSITWGSGLNDRENECYVWRLSHLDHKRGVNYAIRSSGPNYPASCLRSMLKEEEYDVIILEFFMRAMEGLQTLLTRLRDRFPHAIIVVVKLWGPYQIGSEKYGTHDLSLWARQQGFGVNFIHDPKFKQAFLATGPENWVYRFANELKDPLVEYIQQAAREVNAYIVELPFSKCAHCENGWLELGDKFLSEDSFHLSAAGHQNIANQVNIIVNRVGVPKERNAEPFSAIDLCYNWFTSGIIGEIITYSPNGVVDTMPGTEKYTLSFRKDNNQENWIRVSNPTDVELQFLIGYMSTGPPPSKYPKVTAKRENGEQFLLEPDALGWRDRKVHIVRMASLGTIKPHTNVAQVSFFPLEETEYPFRLVQVILTPAGDNKDHRTESMTNRGMSDEVNVL